MGKNLIALLLGKCTVRAITVLNQLLHDDRGATAIEYGLIIALVVVAMVAALNGLGGELIDMWKYVETEVLAVL